MRGALYELRHVPSGRFYIGATIQPEVRLWQWRCNLWRGFAGDRKYLPASFGSFGWHPDEWRFLVLETPLASELAFREQVRVEAARMARPNLLLNVSRSRFRPALPSGADAQERAQ